MNSKQATKLSYIVNTCLLLFVVGWMVMFGRLQATFLVYFSIPTMAVYFINYILVAKKKLAIFVWLVYFWIVLYMEMATICLGYQAGFHLYAFSMISVIFYTEYMAHQLESRSVKAIWVSVIILGVYAISAGYVIYNGPVYEVTSEAQTIMMVINAVIVFSFIIVYSMVLVRMIITSENTLKKMAHVDRLTGLYNRHYMMEQIAQTIEGKDNQPWIAMLDLDGFKGINDKFGHNAGDAVLVRFSEMLTEICRECVCSRWGGEEFLILSKKAIDKSVLEKLRAAVCEKPFLYQEQEIPVSVTIGSSDFEKDMTFDSFVQSADNKLYEGKRTGKNKVIL